LQVSQNRNDKHQRKHIFNPVAQAVALTALVANHTASWGESDNASIRVDRGRSDYLQTWAILRCRKIRSRGVCSLQVGSALHRSEA